jgi:hypothetical protein
MFTDLQSKKRGAGPRCDGTRARDPLLGISLRYEMGPTGYAVTRRLQFPA